MPKPEAKKTTEDLVSWLQYPLEDSFEKAYCSASFEDQPWPILPQSEARPVDMNRTISMENAHLSRSKGVSSFHSNITPTSHGSHGLQRSSSEIAEGAMALGAQRAEKSMSFSSLGGGRPKLRKSVSEVSHRFDSSSIQLSGSSLITNETIPATTSSEYNTSGEYVCASTSAQPSGSMMSSSSFMVCRDAKRVFHVGSGSQGGSLASVDLTSKEESCKEKLCATATVTEGSESQSEDADDECVEVKRPRRTSSSKRNRAAEVHNLSERNRRNRINEKLKALQDLIPNSTKTDKASVLDEAIEYMKSLQMQLQMVSMRNSGMNMSPMIVPVGIPHLQMASHHTMGLGLPIGHPGMGIGMYGQGMMGGPYQPTVPGMSHYGMPYQDGCSVQGQPYNNGRSVESQYQDGCSVESQVFDKVKFPRDEA